MRDRRSRENSEPRTSQGPRLFFVAERVPDNLCRLRVPDSGFRICDSECADLGCVAFKFALLYGPVRRLFSPGSLHSMTLPCLSRTGNSKCRSRLREEIRGGHDLFRRLKKKGDLAGLLSGPNVQCLPFQLLFPMFPDNLLSGFEVLFARQDSFFRPALSDTSDPVRCDIDRYDPDYLHGAIQQDLHAK